jgi:hypothetical protein
MKNFGLWSAGYEGVIMYSVHSSLMAFMHRKCLVIVLPESAVNSSFLQLPSGVGDTPLVFLSPPLQPLSGTDSPFPPPPPLWRGGESDGDRRRLERCSPLALPERKTLVNGPEVDKKKALIL